MKLTNNQAVNHTIASSRTLLSCRGSEATLALAQSNPAIVQLTDVPGGGVTFSSSVSMDDGEIVFHSAADLTGENPDGNDELFRFTRRKPDTQLLWVSD